KGTLSIQLAGREVEAPEGSVVYVPRFTPHGFSNQSASEVTLTLIFNPGQNREGFFRGMKEILSEQPVDQSKFLRLYNKYDSFPTNPGNVLPRVN
ncbi:MAG: Cupin 2 conserved barrel domain protein, partial [Mucilaginibacter sp.]|nr:Cupin 2 conserved barrel domain protein [Mucilaginibacter sp.]